MYIALVLCAVNILIFLLQSIIPLITKLLALDPNNFFLWQIITSMFVHADLIHLGFNMFALVLFGTILEKHIGSKKFVRLYFIAGIASSLSGFIFYPHSLLMGASGAVFGILGALGWLKPKMVVWLLGVPMYMAVAVVVWVVLNLLGLFSPTNVAHAAHLVGLFIGLAYGHKIKPAREEKEKEKPTISEKDIDKWEEEHF